MAGDWIKNLKKQTKTHTAYLRYFEDMKKKKLNPQTYGTWSKTQGTLEGTSKQTKRQGSTLSEDDAKELTKHFGRK